MSCSRTCIAAAVWMQAGMTSFDDWPRLTWSLGCTSDLSPRCPPNNSMARLAITSLAFMFVPFAVGNLTGGGDDGVGLFRREQPQLVVDLRRAQFHQAKRADELAWE